MKIRVSTASQDTLVPVAAGLNQNGVRFGQVASDAADKGERMRAIVVKTEVLLDASPQSVWEILTDFSAYPHWNPFVREIEGEAVAGSSLLVTIKLPEKAERTFRAQVLCADPAQELCWRGHLAGVKFLFVGEHRFYLTDENEGKTRMQHEETFTGWLCPLVLDARAVKRGFEAMNAALQQRLGAAGAAV